MTPLEEESMPVGAIVGYDGSPAASAAIDAGVLLFPHTHAWITYLWVPPFASEEVRRRLRARARDVNDLIALIEREGEHEAERLVARGVTLARAAGWDAEPLLKRTLGGEGLRLAQLTEQVEADLMLVGARGLSGAQAVMGSVSDVVVHYATRPVLVVPDPLLSAEYATLADGPVLVGWDGSAGAEKALSAATHLFPQRDVLQVSVDNGEAAPSLSDASKGPKVLTIHLDRGHGLAVRATAAALIECANERNAAVLVVGSRGRSAASEILLGSVAMATLHHSHRPVMVVPNPSKSGRQEA
jgi:nucleotide-binding universal stress UspA family protein